jgi:replicative DNA helicase
LSELFYDGQLAVDLVHPTTCEQLNQVNGGGIMAKSFITIAAGAGVGKTGFALYLLDAIARAQSDSQCLFFSLEMEAKQIWMRHVGICAKKPFDQLTADERLAAVAKGMQIAIQIYDSSMCKSAADIDFILTTARLKAMDKKISVIVVDYLGLVEAKGNFESNAIKQTDITSKLARLAIELDCIVIALSQINRSPSARASDDRCPYPSDASGSSGSYFSSTLWLGVDRPELYQDDPSYRNQFVVKCRKNRFGGIWELILAFNDGTFAEVPTGWFKLPSKQYKNSEEAVFSAHSKDFYEN